VTPDYVRAHPKDALYPLIFHRNRTQVIHAQHVNGQ
jgi:hypothetical protein